MILLQFLDVRGVSEETNERYYLKRAFGKEIDLMDSQRYWQLVYNYLRVLTRMISKRTK